MFTAKLNNITYLSIDHIIVYIFLISILLAGLYVGRKIKNMRDYSLANKNFGTSILLLTMLATTIGGGSSSGLAAKVYQHGIIAYITYLSIPLSIFLVGKFVIPRIINFEEQDLSMADIMGRFYGENAKILTGIIGFLFCIIGVGIQVMTLGFLFEILLGISKLKGCIIGGGIIIIYTSFGGIRSVAITDVLEFIVLIVIIPILASLAVSKAGGISNMLQNIPITKFEVLKSPNFRNYFIMFILFVFPTISLNPMAIQRIIMAKDRKQIKSIYMIFAAVTLAFYTMIFLLGLSSYLLDPNINYNTALPNTIKTILPIGLKGFAIAGMLAVIMSTGDSALNVGSIFLVHNIMDPLFKKIKVKINELVFIKFASLIIGIAAVYISYNSSDTLKLNFYILSLFSPLVTFPLLCALIGLKGDKRIFYISAGSALITFVIVLFITKLDDVAILSATFANIFSFLIYHYIKNGKFVFISKSFTDEKEIEEQNISLRKIKKYIFSLIPTPKNLIKITNNNIKRYGSSHIMFGAFFCINYIVPIFMWNYHETANLVPMTFLRFMGGLLSVGLILERRWPYNLKKYFPIYWYFSVCFCLPFTSTAMYLLMGASTEWIVNIALTIMLMAWLIDWKSFLILLIIGSINGILFGYFITQNNGSLIEFIRFNDTSSCYILIYTLLFSCLIGVIFFRKKDNDIQKKLNVLKLMAGSMAHEIKNVIGVDISNNMFLKMLLAELPKTIKGNKVTINIDLSTFNRINELVDNLGENTQKGIEIIKRIIVNMSKQINEKEFQILNIKECLNEAIEKYGMTKEQKNNIKIKIDQNIKFIGSKFFFTHILFNLIKNAYRFGREDCKINIWTQENKLFFKDNGPGISKDNLPYIFDYFFTTSSTGAGIGLPFSKMVIEKMDGDIYCDTKTGKDSYTTFIIDLSKIAKI
ncbi:MAG: hypothetical protein GY830_09455 [Bacteroidetes bacterium]|nr:hypothetical protein [Bacteroidota bacterium]